MKELVILSGKGGTGKTSLTAAFASIAKNILLCDTDVDAADLHLLMNPEINKTHDFIGGNEAVIDPDKCTQCGLCMELCRFNAVKDTFEIDLFNCEGCGVCYDLCPEKAIAFPRTVCGQWFISDTRFGPMVHARLGIAQENSGKLVSQVRQAAQKMAKTKNRDLIITDGPPGIGCPVIASIGQATALLLICEPTVSGLHDLKRVIELARHFKIPAMTCINKYDLNPKQTGTIKAFCEKTKIPVMGEIPFDPAFTKALVQGKTILEYDKESTTSRIVKEIWDKIYASSEMKSSLNHLFN
ncbi:MAG: P-loop NTPase [Desulfobacteraceae bacterium]|nr:P-loop NTPase [Desulfobacteraceae bacterium]